MIKIETTSDREIWCTISDSEILVEKIIDDIKQEVSALIPGNERLYINVKTISSVKSEAITALRKMMTEFMSMGCSVRFTSVNANLHDIFENLTLSSDG